MSEREARWLWRGLIAVCACVAVIAVLIHVARNPAKVDPSPTRQVIDAAVARIAAESGHADTEPAVRASPRSSEAARGRTEIDLPPSPPEGYAFVALDGEMPTAAIHDRIVPMLPRIEGREWLRSPTAIQDLVSQSVAAGRPWSFGWIRLSENARLDDLVAELGDAGGEIVGSAGTLIRARLPGDREQLETIAALPAVDGLGVTPRSSKLAEAFVNEVIAQPPHVQVPVFVTLMADDPVGEWRRALEELGAVVGRFDPTIRVYAANVTQGVLEALAEADFVLAIEPVGIVEAAHDTAVPAMGVDALREYAGSPGKFSGTGGASVPIAVMDSGLNINHLDIASNRQSICGANFAWLDFFFGSLASEAEDLWIDAAGHGTHVTGTIVGNGYVEPRFAGMAPSVGHIRFAKVLTSFGFGTTDSILRGMDFLSGSSTCLEGGQMSDRVKPLIVNMSLSERSRLFEGRSVDERKLDSIVWSHRQLYVVAQSNQDIHAFSNYASAKNSLAVGASMDSGDIVPFSSHGPTADGRLAPQVSAIGLNVISASGDGRRGGYRASSGTSMSSPAVAGVAALLMDASPAHRENPALARARLMASAIRPDAWLEAPGAFPATNSNGPGKVQAQYGMGNVSARTSVLNRDQDDGWVSGSATATLEDGTYAYQDIVVPEGANRLDIVMTWDEPPTDAIADAVLNDLDLWLDKDGDCETVACGEHISASRIDNVEWIIVSDPEPGTYRARVAAHRVLSDAPRAALAWTVIRGDSTPTLTMSTSSQTLTGEERDEFTVTVSADAYVAAGARLQIDCRNAVDATAGCDDLNLKAIVGREDGISVDPSDELPAIAPDNLQGVSIPLGEVGAGESQEVRFSVSYDGVSNGARLYIAATAWNAKAASATIDVQRSDTEEYSDVASPANDDFESAREIEGESGSHAVDLLLATPEPGEPAFTGFAGRPAGSVWYVWTAPENGAYRFETSMPADAPDLRNDRIDVFKGDHIAELTPVASNRSGATFFAEKGQQYRVRLSNRTVGLAQTFRWKSGAPPANDDFAQATLVEGASGTAEGTSGGATLEQGEWFGQAAATTWYRWVAPSDGDWTFSSDRPKVVLVLEGDEISTLRLVSQYPGTTATFPANEGNTYRITVAEPDAYTSSGAFTLRWSESTPSRDANDDIAGAELVASEASSRHSIDVSSTSTVEHGEPAESGVRTKWWMWDAPEDGRYTWRLDGSDYPRLRVAAFDGESAEALQLVAENGPDVLPFNLVFEATEGERHWLSAGFASGDLAAYMLTRARADLIWGPTPDNDDVANASALEGAEGAVTGSNEFATTQRGQRTNVLGHSTLWWTYEAPESGWYRFSLDNPGSSWVLAVHRDSADGLGGLDIIRSNTWQQSLPESPEVVFYAEAGSRYTISLGRRGEEAGGTFGLRWAPTDAPAWLGLVGRLADGDADSDGETVEMRGLADLAFNDDGDVLYLGSSLGLQVFERDSETGGLALAQSFEDYFRRGVLFWDPHQTRLLVDDCGTWRSFTSDGDDSSLTDGRELTVADDPGRCGDGLFMDSSGSFLYRVGDEHIDLFSVEDSGDLRFVQTHEAAGLRDAVMASGDGHVYAVTRNALHVYTRDAETGALTRTDGETALSRAETLAISDDDAHLFVFDRNGERTNLFDLEDPASPVSLGDLPRFWQVPFFSASASRCQFATVRMDALVADVFCTGSAFVAAWDSNFEFLEGTDYIASTQPDRFNRHVPEFAVPEDMAASPDGLHVYLATPRHGILIFERIGSQGDEDESE
ncbi:MAG: S8 family serine peptidase [Gammaproteobacteria bacterium]|nr:S8 family serine peptidase [Gammaproteobacteria bacterium]